MTTSIQSHYNYFSWYRDIYSQQFAKAQDTTSTGDGSATDTATETQEPAPADSQTATGAFVNYLRQIRHLAVMTDLYSGTYDVDTDGGDGDDTIDANGDRVRVNGGDGNDTITAEGHKVVVSGGAGDDVITATSNAPEHGPIPLGRVLGGDGNDQIFTQGLTGYVNGGAGDDLIHAADSTIITANGGSGNDTIIAERGALELFGGTGDDTIVSLNNLFKGSAYGGAGEDTVTIAGRAVKAYGGTGNDSLTFQNAESIIGYQQTDDGFEPAVEFRSVANGGLGDDSLTFDNSYGDIEYFAGDGNDTITGADERSVLKLGKGLSFEDTTFTTSGNDLTVSFGEAGGSITFKDYQTKGLPRIEFNDGRQFDASETIAYAGGDPDAYTAGDIA